VSKEEQLIAQYGGYAIDRSVSDSSEKKVIYLTFDTGYENGNVERVVDTLNKNGIKGAFFLLDNIILKNPDLVKKMHSNGHLICNHTKNHKNLSGATREQIEADLTSLEEICEVRTGIKMAKYFRFPEGRYSENALSYVSSLGYKTIFWSFAYEDWDNGRQMDEDLAIKKILSNTHNGAIILLHPTSKTNADIMQRLIDAWRNMGYEFGTLDMIK
jgi:peptidoglycan-N-acetylmuramic acid deacetylase